MPATIHFSKTLELDENTSALAALQFPKALEGV
jgi:hypothetical protein